MPTASITWTSERIEQLRSHLAQGLSYGAIAREFNVSRNTIVGKVNRLALGPRPRVGVRATIRIEEPVEDPVEEPEDNLPGFSLLDLSEHQCRWAIQDEPRYRFCGER
jgi:hypothetical protein